MASFKFRWPGSAGQGNSPDRSQRDAPPSLATLRRRARNRLVGALFLVVLAVLALPWLFDTGPRPVAVDIPIVIPSQDEAPPLSLPPSVEEGQATVEVPVQLPPALPDDATAAQTLPAPDAPVDGTGDEPSTLPPAGQTEVASATPPPVVAAPPAVPDDDGARALALLEGRSSGASSPARSAAVPATATNGRFVVQVGAFSEASRVKTVRQKLEKAGFSTYTQDVETAAGKNTRVRVGPFATRADADKVAASVRELGLPAAVLSLPKG